MFRVIWRENISGGILKDLQATRFIHDGGISEYLSIIEKSSVRFYTSQGFFAVF